MAVFAEAAGQRLVGQQLVQARRVFLAVPPGHEKAVLAVNEPVFDAAGVEGHHRQRVAHDFQADRGNGLRPQ